MLDTDDVIDAIVSAFEQNDVDTDVYGDLEYASSQRHQQNHQGSEKART